MLQTFTTDFKVSMNLYNKRLYLQSLHPKCFSHLYSHNLMRNEKYNNEYLFKSGYTNLRTKMIQWMMIHEVEAQYMLCALVLACLDWFQKMNWFWVYIVWTKKLAVTHILGVSGLPVMESGKPDLCYR